LRHIDRRASPAVAKRVSARIAVTGRGTERARSEVTRRARVVTRRCEPAVEPRRLPGADHYDDCAHDDDDGPADHDDDRAGADDDHDGTTTTAAATAATHDDDDDGTTEAGGHEQRRR
jgi:hypothetical protein